ncbi:putative 26S proteasome non-ATPase regulatory subunit 7 [Blattamonas nauphoetae]|uniref:26S proteasome non-ATPase regulatory subunit 7 n=1 Tax=Blattamonas nauphoetae TaxID=2049346 RepID=A0ABQ9YLP4_9EUKA|nr:putative 26S proteasome non-ATPase regulatory subunit 7 [Blattamonas nauphoetae]
MGTIDKGVVDITNCFAVPFQEDHVTNSWFFDTTYIQKMYSMQRKITVKEVIVGWYSAYPGASINPVDLRIQQMVQQYCPKPTFLVVDVEPKGEFPTKAYISSVSDKDDGTELSFSFQHLACEMGAQEAEEIGVEHLLRDVFDTQMTPLRGKIDQRSKAFASYNQNLIEIRQYLRDVIDRKLPLNQHILSLIQEIFNLTPHTNDILTKGILANTNDSTAVLLTSHILRVLLSLAAVIDNKIELQRKAEKDAIEEEEKKIKAQKEKEEKEKKEQEEKEKLEGKKEEGTTDKK